jgi:phage baseplate assembly protein W
MPLPQTIRVNPLDLQGNIAIGVSLPFNGPSGPFNSTYSTQTQIKSNLVNLLLTNKGERVMNPEFGADLGTVLFEGITESTRETIKNLINTNVEIFVPEVQIVDIIVNDDTNYGNNNTISITINYRLRISGTADQVTVQFI